MVQWFSGFAEKDFARAGYVATEEVTLDEGHWRANVELSILKIKDLFFCAGPLIQFPHSAVPQLVSLGLPASLEKGVVVLMQDHCICKPGDTLSPEQAKILVSLCNEIECLRNLDKQ